MKIDSKDFRVPAGEKISLKNWPAQVEPVYKSKKKYHKYLEQQVEELSRLQRLHYASNRYALLLVFQAMDAAGKDGANRHVMSGVNPQCCQVSSFKHPGAAELDHDFLWRTTRSLPERGRVGIFERCPERHLRLKPNSNTFSANHSATSRMRQIPTTGW